MLFDIIFDARKFWRIFVLAILKTNPFKIWTFRPFLYVSETTRTNCFKISSHNLHNVCNKV